MAATATAVPTASVLATRRGRLTLALLCTIAFLDFADASIVNIALPTIRADLGFSIRGLTWVPSGYLLTYGGFMLLGGRAADLLGRRRVLMAGTAIFAPASLIRGPAPSEGLLVAGPMVEGRGAALMLPAAPSLLTTTFRRRRGRTTARRGGGCRRRRGRGGPAPPGGARGGGGRPGRRRRAPWGAACCGRVGAGGGCSSSPRRSASACWPRSRG